MKNILLTSTLATCILAGITYLFRHWLLAAITNSVQHRYNSDLEALRHQLKQNEISLSLAHKAIIEHSPTFREKQFEALNASWAEIIRIKNLHPTLLLALDVLSDDDLRRQPPDAEFKTTKQNESTILSTLLKDFDLFRPYIDPLPWALFITYRQILARIIIIYHAPSLADGSDWIDDVLLQKAIKGALSSEEVEKLHALHVGKVSFLIKALEEKFLKAMRDQLSGFTASQTALTEAKRIMESAIIDPKHLPASEGLTIST